MASEDVGGSSEINLLLRSHILPNDSSWMSSSPSIHCSTSMVSFQNGNGGDAIETLFTHPLLKLENPYDELDGSLNSTVKKRRLSTSQVQFLESKFVVDNKLEPERKVQLAKELGLQPRQVAIWFQNRRARFKNKQLEKDYDTLRSCYEMLKADYENLIEEKESLRIEIISLKEKLRIREKGMENEEQTAVINSPVSELEKTIPNAVSELISNAPFRTPKQEEASSAKSEIMDTGSSHSYRALADWPPIFEPDQSDFSQDEDDQPSEGLFHSTCLPKSYRDPPAIASNFEIPVEDQPFWVWNY